MTRSISTLARENLISKIPNSPYDGYRLTYGGLDYLSLHHHQKSNVIYSIAKEKGAVGKEADIYVCATPTKRQVILKIHRLGRISFRNVKTKRDYKARGKGSGASWMDLSRLAARKEYVFLTALHAHGFPVPEPLAYSRHTLVMGLVDAPRLSQIKEVGDPAALYADLMTMIMRLAQYGLIHGDFNEFNILVKEEGDNVIPVLIDFPQMVSVDHVNAETYFDRDVNCVKRFFLRRFHFTTDEAGPLFSEARAGVGKYGANRLDVDALASGFNRKQAKEWEKYIEERGSVGDDIEEDDRDDDDDADEEDYHDERDADGDQDGVTQPIIHDIDGTYSTHLSDSKAPEIEPVTVSAD